MKDSFQSKVEAFLRGDAPSTLKAVLRAPLIPAAVLYGTAGFVREGLYRGGLKRVHRLGVPVVSVGNLVLGGTGKTPFIRALARRLLQRGERPLILSRGFGARVARGLDEEGASLARDLPSVPVVQGHDRVAAVMPFLSADPQPTVVLLDDGAQTLSVHRDLNLILVDARCPFGSGWPLPAGTLREFARRGLRRADGVVLTHADAPELAAELARRIERLGYRGPVMASRHVVDRVWPRVSSLAGSTVFAVSGIASPAGFYAMIEDLGARRVGEAVFQDHHRFTASDVRFVESAAAAAGADVILATGKDEPKLTELPLRSPWAFMEVTVRFAEDDAPVFWALLERHLGARHGA